MTKKSKPLSSHRPQEPMNPETGQMIPVTPPPPASRLVDETSTLNQGKFYPPGQEPAEQPQSVPIVPPGQSAHSSTQNPQSYPDKSINVIVIHQADGPTINQTRKLGRLPATDMRDHGFLLPVPKTLPAIQSKVWSSLHPLDQGDSPMCVGFGLLTLLLSGPVKNRRNKDERKPAYAQDAYHRAQDIDEFPGTDYDGTSVRAGMKIGQEDGYFDGYQWAFYNDPIINQVLTKSPVLVGTVWTDTMFNPLSFHGEQFIRVGGSVRGGHCYNLQGVSRKLKCPDGTVGAYRLMNTWGNWADNGRAWISFADFAKLLAEDGEACVPNEIVKVVTLAA